MLTLTVLMDNIVGTKGTLAEHGLSFMVERDGMRIIFDTGKTGAFLDNACTLGIDPAGTEAVVLSHGHYDHGGGVRALCISAGAPGELWTGPSFFDRKWADEDPTPRFNGVDFDPAYLCEHGVENRVVAGKPGEPAMEEVLPGLFVLNGFARVHPSERPNPRFLVDRPASREEDDFRDEVCLVAETARGLVVVLGCAHPGIMNMLETVASVFGKAPYAVFGGSHLLEADEERLELTTRFLEKLDAASGGAFIAGLGHCTGKRAGAYLSERVRGYVPLQTGAHFTL